MKQVHEPEKQVLSYASAVGPNCGRQLLRWVLANLAASVACFGVWLVADCLQVWASVRVPEVLLFAVVGLTVPLNILITPSAYTVRAVVAGGAFLIHLGLQVMLILFVGLPFHFAIGGHL